MRMKCCAVPIAIVILAISTVSCSRDPEAQKREYVVEGDREMEAKRYAEAIIHYRNAVRLDDKFGEARLKLAQAYGQMGDGRNALREAVRASGTKEAVSQTGLYTMRRPDRFYAKTTGPRALEAWYNGKTLTIASHADKVFAQAPMPETTDRTLDALAERYDMALPMGDLFYAPVTKSLLSDTITGGYVGTETVGDTPCYHLAFKDTGADYELWIPTQGEPLPKRFRLVNKGRKGQPVTDIRFDKWDLAPAVTDSMFVPKVPPDYEGIAMVQRAAAVKKSAASAEKPDAKP